MRVKRYSYTGDGEIIQAMEKKNVLKPIAVNVIPLFIYRSVCLKMNVIPFIMVEAIYKMSCLT